MEEKYKKIIYIKYINPNVIEQFLQLPIEIISKRNTMIYLTSCQIISSIIGMLFFLIRRSFVYILINILTLLLAFCGLYGSLLINPMYLFIHSALTISFGGCFFVFQLLSDLITVDTSYGDEKRTSDHILLFIFSMPYLYDLGVGIYNYLWLQALSKLNSNDNDRMKQKFLDNKMEMKTIIEGNGLDNSESNTMCICCLNSKRETTFNPCGHISCCMLCSIKIFQKNKKCPVCRKDCHNFIKLYIS